MNRNRLKRPVLEFCIFIHSLMYIYLFANAYIFIRKCIFIHIARSKLQESRDGIIDSFFIRKYALYFED